VRSVHHARHSGRELAIELGEQLGIIRGVFALLDCGRDQAAKQSKAA
jgi:hypothetical protein